VGTQARAGAGRGRRALSLVIEAMLNAIAADAVLIVHFAFVAFVLAGGALVLRWPHLAWLHLPAVFWGAVVEFTGWICPLTPLENSLRSAAAETAYTGDFIQHYIVALLYPEGLTRNLQLLFGFIVVAANVLIYALLLARMRTREPPAV
jgi:hypothetical protein